MNVDTLEIFYLNGIYAFGACSVHIFFLLAGYYLTVKDNWNYRNNLKKKFRSLVIPYLGFISIYAVINCVGSLIFPAFFDDFRKFTAFDWLMHFFGIPFMKDPIFYGPLWFVLELFIFNVLSFALVPLVKKIPGFLLIPAMILLYFAPVGYKIWYPTFFMIGMYLGFKKKIPVLNNKLLIIAVSVAAFVVPMVSKGEFADKITFLLFAISTLSISEKLVRNEKMKKIAQIAIPFSFPVYLMHEYPVTTVARLLAMKHISIPAAIVAFLVLPVFVVFLCVGVALLWKRISPKSYGLLTGGRY